MDCINLASVYVLASNYLAMAWRRQTDVLASCIHCRNCVPQIDFTESGKVVGSGGAASFAAACL